MNRLEELIQTLCPDDVEHQELAKLADIGTGNSNRVDATDDGKYPFFVRSKNVMRSNKYDFDEEAIVIPGEGGIGEIFHYIHGKYDLHQRAYRIRFRDSRVNTRFAYYYMKSNFKKFITMKAVTATVISIRMPMIASFLLPIPPLPVQEEIVRILDTFTALDTELEAELAARTKQYEHYRNELLSFYSKSNIIEKLLAGMPTEEVTYLKLGGKEGICNVVPSGVDKIIDNNERPVKLCNYMDVYNNRYITDVIAQKFTDGSVSENEYERFVLRQGQVLLTKDSETREDIAQSAYVNNDFDDMVCGYHLAVLTPVKSINGKYLNYVLQSANLRSYFSKMANGVSRYGLKLKSIEDALIPIPPLEVQEQIVSILDRFDALVNDLKSGLPAEIALRRKQYEYYRNFLLSFS